VSSSNGHMSMITIASASTQDPMNLIHCHILTFVHTDITSESRVLTIIHTALIPSIFHLDSAPINNITINISE
jgi:hypothetical protein